jgi:hypothetical protein
MKSDQKIRFRSRKPTILQDILRKNFGKEIISLIRKYLNCNSCTTSRRPENLSRAAAYLESYKEQGISGDTLESLLSYCSFSPTKLAFLLSYLFTVNL